MSIEVVLADDHAVVRDGIKAVIEGKAEDIKVIAEAANGDELLKIAKKNPADVYILDISMPILNGIETTSRLRKMYPKAKIIILSIHDERTFVEKALRCGAKGYVLKESSADEVVNAIRQVYANRFFISPKIAKFVVQGFIGKTNRANKPERTATLTTRERAILQLIAEGFTNKEMARQLKLSLNTVHAHRNNIMHKLDMHRQAELIRYALKEGISQL